MPLHDETANLKLSAAIGFLHDRLKTIPGADDSLKRIIAELSPSGPLDAPAIFRAAGGGTSRPDQPIGAGRGEPLHPQAGLDALEAMAGALKDMPPGLSAGDRFLWAWRFWQENAKKTGRVTVDQSIWTGMFAASALAACRGPNGFRPAFLIIQIGPIQDFIAQARSTRDLWSGSYLLSWLMGKAARAVADIAGGPDAIVFPSLKGQGVVDAIYREDYSRMGEWKGLARDSRRLLTPTLTNRLLAILPANTIKEAAITAEKAIRDELDSIGETCLGLLAKHYGLEGHEERWRAQIKLLPRIDWASADWDVDSPLERAIADFRSRVPAGREGMADRLEDARNTWFPTAASPEEKAPLLYPMAYHTVEYLIAARRNTRDFSPFDTDTGQAGAVKDALTGREEVIGSETWWQKNREQWAEERIIRQNEGPYGAVTLLKRLWCHPLFAGEPGSLAVRAGVGANDYRAAVRFESAPDIAARNHAGVRPGKDDWDTAGNEPKNPYVAAIAMDGDKMGRWLSGEKLLLRGGPSLLVTPTYHVSFSHALSAVAGAARATVEDKCRGQLVYAGGDDILALVPSDFALKCVDDLREIFRGNQPFVTGAKTEVSCGIAIAHCQHPLQMIVREAREAAHRAKREPRADGWNRAAAAVTLLKRSGETAIWGMKWEMKISGDRNVRPLDLYARYRELRDEQVLSSRFPYALQARLAPYTLEMIKPEGDRRAAVKNAEGIGKAIQEIIACELDQVIARQGKWRKNDSRREEFRRLCLDYLEAVATAFDPPRYEDFPSFFLTAAFIERERGKEEAGEAAGADAWMGGKS